MNGLSVIFTATVQLFNTFAGVVIAKLLCIALAVLVSWFAGLFIGDTVLAFFAQLGVTDLSMAQIGAVLGFVGSFFYTPIRFTDLRGKKENVSSQNTTV